MFYSQALNFFIGELAPLLSVLGDQMHKRHKTACTLDLDARPDLDACGFIICLNFGLPSLEASHYGSSPLAQIKHCVFPQI
jgi:hypothetical protein